MPSISVPTAMLIAGGVSAGAGLIGSSQQAGAAKSAAQLQYQSSQQAAALQWQMFQQMQGNLQPYMNTGVNALNSLAMLTGTAGSNDAQIRQLQQQLQQLTGGAPQGSASPGMNALNPTAGFGGVNAVAGGGTGSQTPGVAAAMAAALQSGRGGNLGTAAVEGLDPTTPLGPLGSMLGMGGLLGLGKKNNSALQDIHQALQAGLPVSDASWAEAGFGPGGAALGDAGGSPLSPEVQAQVQAIQKQISDLQGSNQPGNPLTAPLTSKFNPTMQQLEQTPGYQFTLQQGLRATQNSATAMGLGASGSAIAGAGDYAAGLASQTYQQQFNNYWSQNQNIYNMLAGLTQQGQASAAGVGSAGLQTGGAIGNLLTGGASALGAGQIGAANAWAGGLSNAAGAGSNALLLQALSKNGLFGASGAAKTSPSLGAAGYAVTDDYGNPVE